MRGTLSANAMVAKANTPSKMASQLEEEEMGV